MDRADLRIVVIGGGTGCPAVLSGLRGYTQHLTAVVTVMDSGGSSGQLRRELGVVALGDIRRCLVALAGDAGLQSRLALLFERRLVSGSPPGDDSQGNLLLASLTQTQGGVEEAIEEAGRWLGVVGAVAPVTLESAELITTLADGSTLEGEAALDLRGPSCVGVRGIDLRPRVRANPRALEAIHRADAVILGPGDLYTSVLPNLLVEGMPEAVRASRGRIIYIGNLATKPGETDGYRTSDFVREVLAYLGRDEPLDALLLDGGGPAGSSRAALPAGYVRVDVDAEGCRGLARRVVVRQVAREDAPALHDPARTAAAIVEILDEVS